MPTTPQNGGASSASRDVANLGLVRPPLVYLISLVSGFMIHFVVPLSFLPVSLAVPLGVPLVELPSHCSLTRLRDSEQPARLYPPESPLPLSCSQARIVSAGTRSILRSPYSNSVLRSGSTACGCWLHSSERWR